MGILTGTWKKDSDNPLIVLLEKSIKVYKEHLKESRDLSEDELAVIADFTEELDSILPFNYTIATFDIIPYIHMVTMGYKDTQDILFAIMSAVIQMGLGKTF